MKTDHSFFALALSLLIAMTAHAEASSDPVKSMDDATVLAVFDAANTADISTARLGIKNAKAESVRELASMVARDHEDVQKAGRDLARKLGIVPSPPDGDQTWRGLADAVDQLQKLSGRDFDRAYIRYEFGFHRAVISAIRERLLPSVNEPEIHAFISGLIPAFEHHLAETEAVARQLAIDVSAISNADADARNGCMLRRDAMR